MTKQLISTFACMVDLGCQSTGAQQASTETSSPSNAVAVAPTGQESNGFSLGRVFRWAGFQCPAEPASALQPSLIPPELVKLGDAVDTITARASELSVHDPPEVTRQKAQAILEATQPWDTLLAAGQSTGLVNEEMISSLNQFVLPIQTEAQKIVQHGSNPQTIQALQQLGGSLQSTYSNATALMSQGAAAYRYFTGGTPAPNGSGTATR